MFFFIFFQARAKGNIFYNIYTIPIIILSPQEKTDQNNFAIVLSRTTVCVKQDINIHFPLSARHGQDKVSKAPDNVLVATGVPTVGIMSLPLPMNSFCLPGQVVAVVIWSHRVNFPLHPPPDSNFHYYY